MPEVAGVCAGRDQAGRLASLTLVSLSLRSQTWLPLAPPPLRPRSLDLSEENRLRMAPFDPLLWSEGRIGSRGAVREQVRPSVVAWISYRAFETSAFAPLLR